jgi:4-hydroxybenzoate polyprenyltransferase
MICYFAALAILAGVGTELNLSLAYYLGLIAAMGIAIYHYFLIRTRERERCFKAFLHNNWFGVAVFAGIVLNQLH